MIWCVDTSRIHWKNFPRRISDITIAAIYQLHVAIISFLDSYKVDI